MKKQLSIPKTLFRSATFDKSAIDEEARTVEMSIASDAPYERYFGNEILDHGDSSIRMDRLKSGAPLLFNHDRSAHIGRIIEAKSDGKNLRIKAKFGNSALAKEKFQDVCDGILRETSVGYQVNKMEMEKEGGKGEPDTYRVTDWCPMEGSLVTIPADSSVGVGRAEDTGDKTIFVETKNDVDETPENTNKPPKQTKHMAEPTTPAEPQIDVVKERADAVQRHKDGSKKIREWLTGATKNHPEWNEALSSIATKHIDGDADFSKFMEEAVPAIPGVQKGDTGGERKPKYSKNERRQWSLRKAIADIAFNGELSGIEKEMSEDAAKEYQGKDSRNFSGLIIPDDMRYANFAEDHDLGQNGQRALVESMQRIADSCQRNLAVSVFSAGGALVGTELLAGSMIELLRNAALIGQGPLAVTELTGLTGNIAIPKQTGTGTVYWLAEAASVTESDQAFAQLSLMPHRMGCDTAFSKQLLLQSSISIEQFVRSDIALNMAVEEDRVAINGLGASGEPLGILNTSGVLANVTFSGNATYAKAVALEYGLENANVRSGAFAMLTSPLTKSYLKTTLKNSTLTFPSYVGEDNNGEFPSINGVMPIKVNGYACYASKNVTTNVLIMGRWKDFIKARWGGLDTVVDPYSGKKTETIEVTVHQWMDSALRYATAFNPSVDSPTAPS